MSRCDKYMEMASAHLDGELSREETRELLEHLEQCAECRRFYETIKMFSDETGVSEAPEGFAEGVMNALRPAEGEKAAPKKANAAPRQPQNAPIPPSRITSPSPIVSRPSSSDVK